MEDMAIPLTLGIIVPLPKGMIYLTAWAIVHYPISRQSRASDLVMAIVPTLFPFNNSLLLGNSGLRLFCMRAKKGSQYYLQNLVNNTPEELSWALLRDEVGVVHWLSPLHKDGYKEWQDSTLWKFVTENFNVKLPPVKDFWPNRSPSWDGIAVIEKGNKKTLVLVEAKAQISELISNCKATSPASKTRIAKSLASTKDTLGVVSKGDWTKRYYQFANRIAHALYLRRQLGIDIQLVYIYFYENTSQKLAASYEKWKTAICKEKSFLGLDNLQIDLNFYHEAFLDISNTNQDII